MKTAFLDRDGFVVKELPELECGAGEVLVKTAACGVCEGDLFQYKSALGAWPSGKEALIGHEGNGVVVETGAGVSGFKPGDKVACNGGFYSEYFVANPAMLAKIPDGLPFEEALGEPVACYVHAAGRFGMNGGERVAVLGCGFMGLGCLEMARLDGASEIWAFDPIAWRREKALSLGASKALDPGDFTSKESIASMGLFDLVIEAAGVQATLDMATEMVTEHGRIVIVGYHQSSEGRRSIDMKTWNYKALDVVNGHVRRDDEKLKAMERGLELIASGGLNMKSLTRCYKFDEINLAFEDLKSRKEGLFKAVLRI